MDIQTAMTDAQCTAAIVAVVAAARAKFPKIDGLVVLGVSMAIGVALAFLTGAGDVRAIVQHGIIMALAASGGMQALSYHATKGAVTVATLAASMPPPAPQASQRGCAMLRPVFALGTSVIGVGLLAFAVHGCSGVKVDPKTVATIDDAALALCKLWAAENIPAGKTVEQVIAEVCMAANTLQPFKDETMAAKGRVGARIAMVRLGAAHGADAGE